MIYLQEIIDRIFILICCTVLYLMHADISYAIIPFILSVIISSLFMYFDNDHIRVLGFIGFIIICYFMPFYIIYLPLIAYDIFKTKYQFIVLLTLPLVLSNRSQYTFSVMTYIIIILLISCLLKYKTKMLTSLQYEYNDLRDHTAEFTMLQEEKNQSILKNQDYEINLATLNERNRISKELHDNIGHMLSRSILQVGALLTVAKDDEFKDNLSDLKDSLSLGMDQIRNTIHNMYDESIDLYAQVEQLVKEFTFCVVNFEYDINTPPDLQLKYSIIAIIKEALVNISKHSNATRAYIRLREHPAMYQLVIDDNGTIDGNKKEKLLCCISEQEYNEGMGIRNMADRIKSFNGNINISIEHGYKIFITIPKNQL